MNLRMHVELFFFFNTLMNNMSKYNIHGIKLTTRDQTSFYCNWYMLYIINNLLNIQIYLIIK